MNEKVNFENFKPILRQGHLSPQGNKLVYETSKPFEQYFLPLELADFLIYCDGENTIREIIELIYKKKKSIHFRLIYKSIYYLKDKGLFENGDELIERSLNPENKAEQMTFFKVKPIFSMYLGKRITNDETYPNVFYFLSLAILALSFFAFKDFDIVDYKSNFLKLDGSYFNVLVFFFIFNSLMLSAKNILKCILLIFLTGRAYNFRLVFNGFAFYFKVASDSLFLISNKLYLSLLHLSVSFSYFFFTYCIYLIAPNFPNYDLILAGSFLLLLVDLNPFQESEFNSFFKSIFQDESVFRLAHYYKSPSLLNTLSTLNTPKHSKIFRTYILGTAFWTLIALSSLYLVLNFNFQMMVATIKAGSVLEKLATLLMLSTFLTLFVLISINIIKILSKFVLSPFLRMIQRKGDDSDVSKDLEDIPREKLMAIISELPLFNYFSNELLNMILDKSQDLKVPEGKSLIQQGDVGNELFVLMQGEVKVIKDLIDGQSKEITTLKPTSIFGEIAAIEECQRTAHVITSKPSHLLSIPANIIRHAAEESQYIREIHAFKNIIMINQFFSSAPLFRELPEDVIHMFMMKGKIENYENNEVVFRQGTKGNGFYLIIRGEVDVQINGNKVSQIKQGGFFGEISVIADVPRTASIVAHPQTMLLKVSPDAFWEILCANIEMAMFIETVGEMRIKEDIEVLNAN